MFEMRLRLTLEAKSARPDSNVEPLGRGDANDVR
jgi:hypothetical protein